MKEILKQILESNQEATSCFWIKVVGSITGKIVSITDEILTLDAVSNERSGMYWTTYIRIDDIVAIDFRSDVRPLTMEEYEDMGLSIPEEENTTE